MSSLRLKQEYIDMVLLDRPDIVGEVSKIMKKKSPHSAYRWFRHKKHDKLCNMGVLNMLSDRLQVPVEDLTEEVPA